MQHFLKSFWQTSPLMADIMPVCMFFWWPPPKSIYLKTLTNSNYMGPLLWYAIFLSSPAIFDSWADPPPLAHSCLLACCSWHHIQKSSSLSAVLSKKKRDIKRLVRGSVDMNIAEPSLSLRRWVKSLYVRRGEEREGGKSQTPFGPLCVNVTESPLLFQHKEPQGSGSATDPLPEATFFLSFAFFVFHLVSVHTVPYHAMRFCAIDLCQPNTNRCTVSDLDSLMMLYI